MNEPFPIVELGVALIVDAEGRFLMDYSEPWGSFTFPMTKLGVVPAVVPDGPSTQESPLTAATRAAVEVLGRPMDPKTLQALACEVPPYNQSGRDGQWKRYTVHLFRLTAKTQPNPLPGHVAVWLTRAELETLEPISPTVRKILAVL